MSGTIGSPVRPMGAQATRMRRIGRPMRLRLPAGVSGQLAVLVVVTILTTHLVIAATLFMLGLMPAPGTDSPGGRTNRFAVVLRMLDAAPPEQRPAVFALAKAAETSLALILENGPHPTGQDAVAMEYPQVPRLLQILGPGFRLVPSRASIRLDDDDVTRVAITTPNDITVSAELSTRSSSRPPHWIPILVTVLFLAAILSVLSAWAARALAAPLKRLAEAAEAFGSVDDSTPLPDRGPREVLTVSRALGRMRDRVKRLIDDRTRMLAAISHDLRTPITRMRLRAEFMEDETARASTLRDLDQMNALLEAALSFVRDGHTNERVGALDLAALVQTVCDGFVDVGADVEAETLRHVLVNGRSDELQRGFTNLIDNAVKYGGRVRIGMNATATSAVVTIADEGPGIPLAEHAAMLEPFVRGDRARNLDETPGFGLGLSIATAIVEAHSGRIGLANREPHGLVVTVELPRASTLPASHAGAAAEHGGVRPPLATTRISA